MTVVTLRPNSTIVPAGTVTGAATTHAALNDDSDSSYAVVDFSGLRVGLDDHTLPAGAVIKSTGLRVRAAKVTTTPALTHYVVPSTPTPTTPVSWSVPTTWMAVVRADLTDSDLDAADVVLYTSNAVQARIYEVYVDVTHVALPVVAVDAITDPVTDTNQPTITWVDTLDADGGVQTTYQVKVFTDAQYGAGGFDADTSTATVDSGELAGADLSWQVTETLPDDTYRAYVRVAQTVNGVLHWSDWAFDEFTVDVALPGVPTLVAAADDSNGRIILTITDNAGDATTDGFEAEVSYDGGTTWGDLRTTTGDGLLLTSETTVYDYEAPNGVPAFYRVRARHDYGGSIAASDWGTDNDTWSSADWWLKNPLDPTQNMVVKVRSLKAKERAGRAGIFQALGASTPVVVQDTRETGHGDLVLRMDTSDEQIALDALIDEGATLLAQGPLDSDEPGYVRILSHVRERAVDRSSGVPSFDTLQFVVVASSPGVVSLYPLDGLFPS